MRWLAVALLSATVATCGQKGPLTLPEDDIASITGTELDCDYGVRP